MIDAKETKRRKAEALRYRKPLVKNINLDDIQYDICEISEKCDEVRYFVESDEETLINALDGDEDEVFEFKMMFAELSADCERMYEDLQQEYVPECFDIFFVAAAKDKDMMGWDSYEQDYYGLSGFESSKAVEEAEKRLERLTKSQLIEASQQCFKIFYSYIGLRHRYDCLKAAMDILRDKNAGYLQMVKRIGELYKAAEKEEFKGYLSEACREYDRLLACMPQEAWIQ